MQHPISCATDFPVPLKMWEAYRSRLLAAWMQREGLTVILSARAQPGCPWLLEGMPHGGTVVFRETSKDGSPVVEIHPPNGVDAGGIKYQKIHFTKKKG